jgi:hypothetical protein
MSNAAKKFDLGPTGKGLPGQDAIDKFNARLNSAGGMAAQPGQDPFWQTGARALIRVAGRPIAVCQEVRWNVQYNAQPIYTIDTPFAWDIDIGVPQISASLSRILDPTAGPEVDGLFATMQAAVHQPYVEMQVLDKIGTSLFFARGMFTGVAGSVTRGAVSNLTANFVGVQYQHYVDQKMKPYNSIGGTATKVLNSLKKLGSTYTGGLL